MAKVGVVLCQCKGQIDGRIDLEIVAGQLAKNKNVAAIVQLDMGCSPEGKDAVDELLKNQEIDRLVVAACSPLAKGAVFAAYVQAAKIPPQQVEVVNIREQCAWVHSPEDATKKAVTLINMGINRVMKAKDMGHWELSCAHINKLKCDKCKRCIEECPNKAIVLGEDGYPHIDPAACVKCGVCVGGCPIAVISLPEFRLEEVSSMLKPLSKEEGPAVAAFCCDYAYEEIDVMGHLGEGYPKNFYPIKVPCTGAVNMILVNDAIADGIDGIMVVGCDASQCQKRKGNEMARVRIKNAQEGLEEQFLEKERLTYVSLGEGFVEPSYIDPKICSKCDFCKAVCPFGAIKVTEEGINEIQAKACRACGSCAAACPSGAITLSNCSDQQILDAIDLIMAG